MVVFVPLTQGGDRYPAESEVKRLHSLHVIRVHGVNQR